MCLVCVCGMSQPHSSERTNAHHSCRALTGGQLLGSSVSSTLGNWSWAMTCTHWSPLCQTQSDEFSRSLASLFLSSGKCSKGEQHQVPGTVSLPNPADPFFHQATTEGRFVWSVPSLGKPVDHYAPKDLCNFQKLQHLLQH